MSTISKTPKKAPRRKAIKVSEQRVVRSASPAEQVEAFLLREGFHPTTPKEKAFLKKNGLFGMPDE